MQKKILLVFAQVGEAKGILARSQAVPVGQETTAVWTEGEQNSLYQFENGFIIISGMGLHAAQMAVAKYAHLGDEVWNFGLAGALKDSLPIGDILQINTVGKYLPLEEKSLDLTSQECVSFTLPHFSLEGSGGKLISSDFPIHDTFHRFRLAKAWDLVDMEGYGIAFACKALKKKCRMWKIISDFASPNGRDLIRKHKAELAEKLGCTIIELMQLSLISDN